MSAVTINGFAAPVSVDGWNDGVMEIADRARSLSGSYLGTRRAIKRTFGGKIITTDATEAEAFRSMINGEGYGWSFGTDARDDWKGNAGWVGASGNWGPSYGKYATGQIYSTDPMVWTFPAGFPTTRWSLSFWYYTSAWHHYTKIYGTTTVWIDGVGGSALPAWLSFSSTGITLGGSGKTFSEIVAYPFLMPTTWPAIIAARTTALTKPPFVSVGGDFVTVPGTTAYNCRGQALQCESQNRGALDRLQRIPFTLEEA